MPETVLRKVYHPLYFSHCQSQPPPESAPMTLNSPFSRLMMRQGFYLVLIMNDLPALGWCSIAATEDAIPVSLIEAVSDRIAEEVVGVGQVVELAIEFER